MTAALRPVSFTLLSINLIDVGPLRGTTQMAFADASGKPSNIFLMMGPNGSGKTTILDAVFCAMSLLNGEVGLEFGIANLDDGTGGIQLDARVELDDGDRVRAYVLSIIAGTPGLLRTWSKQELDAVEATDQINLIYAPIVEDGLITQSRHSHEVAKAFTAAVAQQQMDAPRDLFETIFAYPTVLYFTADRGIRRPPGYDVGVIRPSELFYKPAHRFGADGETWSESLDNLFVWFAWLDEDREERFRALVNDLVFRGQKRLGPIDRQNLLVPVEVGGQTHRLHELSSGERQLVQLVARIASHMTGSTIVLIDEMEQHLHTVFQRRLVNIIKKWLVDYEGLSFIMTSHQRETYRSLSFQREELGLVKGGALIKPPFKQSA